MNNTSDDNKITGATSGGLPAPVGTDDNGNPYWIVGDRKIFWAEMQQYMWQQTQNQPKSPSGNPEVFPSGLIMPNFEIPSTPERGVENTAERRETRDNENLLPIQQNTQLPSSKSDTDLDPDEEQKRRSALFGDSAKLSKVDTSSDSVLDFVENHSDGLPTSSNAYLALLIRKILQTFSVNKK